MSDNDSRNDDLRAWLRRGDPVSDCMDPSPDRTARMRERILTAADSTPRRRPAFLAALAATAALVALLLLLRPAPPTHRTVMPESVEDRAPSTSARQIHFVTEGGTRIVWTLDPDFEL